MGGGLLNLVSEGNKNIFLNGNPKKSFFSTKYSKYTNFGMEKIRVDLNGNNKLNNLNDSKFKFKISQYGDLLLDTYFVVTLPNIWSPIVEFYPEPKNYVHDANGIKYYSNIKRNIFPYEFKWIDNLGSQIIRNVKFFIGGVLIQEFTGQYLYNSVERDFSEAKKKLYYEMTGNTKDLNDPGNYAGRNNNYPNAIYNKDWLPIGPEPSIRSKKIYIPLNIFSTLNNKLPIPLTSFDKQNLRIEITCRPLIEICQVRYIPEPDILEKYNEIMIRNDTNNYTTNTTDPSWNEEIKNQYLNDIKYIGEYVKPIQSINKYLFYRFLNPPYSPELNSDVNDISNNRYYNGTITGTSFDFQFYQTTNNIFNNDVHLICNYVFLSNDEIILFKKKKISYLLKFVDELDYQGLIENTSVKLLNKGLVTSWMWYFQRNDSNLRNEWSNYTNWKSNNLEYPIINQIASKFNYKDKNLPSLFYKLANNHYLSKLGINNIQYFEVKNYDLKFYNKTSQNQNIQFNNLNSIYNTSSILCNSNIKNICKNISILFDGDIRENNLYFEYLNSAEPFVRNNTYNNNVLYYNFCLNSNNSNYQPNGCINLSKYNNVSMNIELISGKKNDNAETKLLVNSQGEMIGINKTEWEIFETTYDMHFMQERYIILTFEDGNIELNNLI